MTPDTQIPLLPLRGVVNAGEIYEKEKLKDVGIIKRGRIGDWSIVRNSLIWIESEVTPP